MKIKPGHYLTFILIIFGSIYALISLINHYLFRTYALDLGLYTHAIYQYAHLKLADSMMIKPSFEYLLGGHFDLYLVIFSPFVYLFGTYTLLIIQILAILVGGMGIFKYFSTPEIKNKYFAIFATVYFFAFYGIYSALSYDYHSTVVAVMAVPWFFFFFKKKNYLASTLTLLFILISQENVSLWAGFICLGLLFEYRKDKKALKYLSFYSLASFVYFIIVIYLIIPYFTSGSEYTGFTYSILGNTPAEAIKNLFLNPVDNFKALFINLNHIPHGDFIKMEMHLLVLLSGSYLLVLRPYYLIMLIPVFVQKLYHDSYLVWGIDGQYSIEFAPILAIGVFTVISRFKEEKSRNALTAIALFGVFISTFRVMDNTVMYTNKSRIRFYSARHYERKYDAKPVYKLLNQLPGQTRISALTSFVPHLALRDHIYQFPLIKDAEYIVYSEKEGKYPLSEEDFAAEIKKLLDSGEWQEEVQIEGFVILKKTEVGGQMTND